MDLPDVLKPGNYSTKGAVERVQRRMANLLRGYTMDAPKPVPVPMPNMYRGPSGDEMNQYGRGRTKPYSAEELKEFFDTVKETSRDL